MAFDPLSWMVSFSLGRVAGRILQPSKDKQLAKKLQRTLEDWAKKNDPPVRAATLETIFSPVGWHAQAKRRHESREINITTDG